MKISEMTKEELVDAMAYMSKVPKEDPHFSGWNFDQSEWKSKYIELIDQMAKRLNLEDE